MVIAPVEEHRFQTAAESEVDHLSVGVVHVEVIELVAEYCQVGESRPKYRGAL
jgi:hypothetical protein